MSNETDIKTGEARADSPATTGSAGYAHEWQITVKADELSGAMDAVWQCWKAWRDGNEPIGGSCPASMGDRMDYRVMKTKRPTPQTTEVSEVAVAGSTKTSGVRPPLSLD